MSTFPLTATAAMPLGDHFFAGETVKSEIRRGVIAFDIAGSIPAGSTITSVSLSMNMSRTLFDTIRIVELRVVLADWGDIPRTWRGRRRSTGNH